MDETTVQFPQSHRVPFSLYNKNPEIPTDPRRCRGGCEALLFAVVC